MILALLLALAPAQFHHALVTRKAAAVGGYSWANTASLKVDGADDFANCGQPADVVGVNHTTTARTYCLWARPNVSNMDGTFFAVAEQTNRPIQIYTLTGVANFYLGTNTTAGSGALTSGTWYHFCLANSAAGAATLYRNGTSHATTTAGSAAQLYDILLGARRNSANTGTAFLATANIAHVTAWSVQFSGTDVTNLYNGGTPIDPTTHAQAANLIHSWPMNGDSGTTITDRKGSANCTISNATAGFGLDTAHP